MRLLDIFLQNSQFWKMFNVNSLKYPRIVSSFSSNEGNKSGSGKYSRLRHCYNNITKRKIDSSNIVKLRHHGSTESPLHEYSSGEESTRSRLGTPLETRKKLKEMELKYSDK